MRVGSTRGNAPCLGSQLHRRQEAPSPPQRGHHDSQHAVVCIHPSEQAQGAKLHPTHALAGQPWCTKAQMAPTERFPISHPTTRNYKSIIHDNTHAIPQTCHRTYTPDSLLSRVQPAFRTWQMPTYLRLVHSCTTDKKCPHHLHMSSMTSSVQWCPSIRLRKQQANESHTAHALSGQPWRTATKMAPINRATANSIQLATIANPQLTTTRSHPSFYTLC